MNFIPRIVYEFEGQIINFEFDSPPSGQPFNEIDAHDVRTTLSNNGTKQFQYNYGRKNITVAFDFQRHGTKLSLQDFFNNFAVHGGTFKYYIHSDDTQFHLAQINDHELEYEIQKPTDVPGVFEFHLEFSIGINITDFSL